MLAAKDQIDLDRVRALAGVLNRDEIPGRGDILPLYWHIVFFLPRPKQNELGADGHPLQGYPTPPAPGMKRMFAGGQIRMNPGLIVGSEYQANTDVIKSVEKQGSSGSLHFMTTQTDVLAEGQTVLTEERNIVYLPNEPTKQSPTKPSANSQPVDLTSHGDSAPVEIKVDPVLLFRVSALTYNAHRIHYDRQYTQEVEGYSDLVVHGPLQALLMAEAGTKVLGVRPVEMKYQLISPLFVNQGLYVHTAPTENQIQVTITDRSGRATAKATISPID